MTERDCSTVILSVRGWHLLPGAQQELVKRIGRDLFREAQDSMFQKLVKQNIIMMLIRDMNVEDNEYQPEI